MKAGFGKRLLSVIIDLTLVISIIYLLFLFPFRLILGKTIDSNFFDNYKDKYDEIEEDYLGKSSYFGTSTAGIFQQLSTNNKNKYMTEDESKEYKRKIDANYLYISTVLDGLWTNINSQYNSETSAADQAVSQLNLLCDTFNYHQIGIVGAEKSVIQAQKEIGAITDDELKTKEKEIEDTYKAKYMEIFKIIYRALLYYENVQTEENDLKISESYSYIALENLFKENDTNIDDVKQIVFTEGDITVLKTQLTEQNDYVNAIFASLSVYNPSSQEETEALLKYNMSQKEYYAIYYEITVERLIRLLPYQSKVEVYQNGIIIYALSSFIVLISLYSMLMKGNTLGRKIAKIRVGGKTKPLNILLHDVVLKYLYILIIIYFFGLTAALFIVFVFFVLDFCMITFNQTKRTLRDYISKVDICLDGYGF